MRMRSPRTVQQMQPLFISMMSSSPKARRFLVTMASSTPTWWKGRVGVKAKASVSIQLRYHIMSLRQIRAILEGGLTSDADQGKGLS